jgi:hypothetical protein
MRHFAFYDALTGIFSSARFALSDASTGIHAAELALNTPPGLIAIEGDYNFLAQRVDLTTGHVVDYQPPAPSADHEWNAETKRWQLNATAVDRANRRTAAIARIAELDRSQHRFLRKHALGDPQAIAKLKEIDDEIEALEPAADSDFTQRS